jgi:hypothetical protein
MNDVMEYDKRLEMGVKTENENGTVFREMKIYTIH